MVKAADEDAFMSSSLADAPSAIVNSHRDMALSLIHEMGYDAAVAVCCEHGWRDALQELMCLNPDGPQTPL